MKNSKRILSTVIGAVFALSATRAFAATTLKLSHNQNRDHAVHKAMTQFADDVKPKQTVTSASVSTRTRNWATSVNPWN